MSTRSIRGLLVLAAAVFAFALAVAPASFAGEDDQGPTQAGEVLGTQTSTSAPSKPAATHTESSRSGSSQSSGGVLGATFTVSKDTTRARGGIQTGVGGMASTPALNLFLALALAGGGLLSLGAAGRFAPRRHRSEV
jgi:hypothetical protein